MTKKLLALFGLILAAGCEMPCNDNSETITAGGDVVVIQNSDGTTEVVNKPKEEIVGEAK